MTELVLLLPLILLAVAAVIDLRTREVPDWITVALVLFAASAAWFGWAGIRWWMVGSGAALGLVVGLALHRFAGFGGGDGKLIAGIGAFLGPVGLLFVLFWMALAGGVLALVAMYRGQRDYAYGPAILLGYIGYLVYPADVWSAISKLLN
ncbi:MAG: prepilin peptidase [Planctomycetaceae bacterium]